MRYKILPQENVTDGKQIENLKNKAENEGYELYAAVGGTTRYGHDGTKHFALNKENAVEVDGVLYAPTSHYETLNAPKSDVSAEQINVSNENADPSASGDNGKDKQDSAEDKIKELTDENIKLVNKIEELKKDKIDLQGKLNYYIRNLADKTYECDQWETVVDIIGINYPANMLLTYVKANKICKWKGEEETTSELEKEV